MKDVAKPVGSSRLVGPFCGTAASARMMVVDEALTLDPIRVAGGAAILSFASAASKATEPPHPHGRQARSRPRAGTVAGIAFACRCLAAAKA